jgi:hypothetical protein
MHWLFDLSNAWSGGIAWAAGSRQNFRELGGAHRIRNGVCEDSHSEAIIPLNFTSRFNAVIVHNHSAIYGGIGRVDSTRVSQLKLRGKATEPAQNTLIQITVEVCDLLGIWRGIWRGSQILLGANDTGGIWRTTEGMPR